ncbi:MAG: phenylacetate-CoA oxygenase subunit PaaC [Phycisphaerae bacterium]
MNGTITSLATAAVDSMNALTGDAHHAVVNLLFRLADDELILGHGSTSWAKQVPSGEPGLPFEAIARDERDHARAYYELLGKLGRGSVESLVLQRGPRRFRCASLVCSEADPGWARGLLRQFLYDAAEVVRLTALRTCHVGPLAELASWVHRDEQRHLMYGRKWVIRLALAGDEPRQALQRALADLYPHALGLFEPTEADETLAQAGICPREEELQQQWESAVAPVLAQADLDPPITVHPVYGGRVGRHPPCFGDVLQSIQDFYVATS